MTSSKKPSAPLRLSVFRKRPVQRPELTRSCRYDDIRRACVTQLLSALRDNNAGKTTWAKVCDVVDAHFKGDLEHVADTLSLLWRTANQVDDTATTSDGTPSVHVFPTPNSPTGWKVLQTALVKSIREGIFFDRECWALHSRKGNAFKAIYFSSVIIGNELETCE